LINENCKADKIFNVTKSNYNKDTVEQITTLALNYTSKCQCVNQSRLHNTPIDSEQMRSASTETACTLQEVFFQPDRHSESLINSMLIKSSWSYYHLQVVSGVARNFNWGARLPFPSLPFPLLSFSFLTSPFPCRPFSLPPPSLRSRTP